MFAKISLLESLASKRRDPRKIVSAGGAGGGAGAGEHFSVQSVVRFQAGRTWSSSSLEGAGDWRVPVWPGHQDSGHAALQHGK